MKDHVISVLLKLYPARWRNEYGDELRDTLNRDPLTPNVTVNVLWFGLWHRVARIPMLSFWIPAAVFLIGLALGLFHPDLRVRTFGLVVGGAIAPVFSNIWRWCASRRESQHRQTG
jgi:hypothetical protein